MTRTRVHVAQDLRAEKLMIGLILALIFLIGTDVIQTVLGPGGIGGPIRLLLLLPIYTLVLINHRFLVKAVVSAPELTLLLALAVASAAWSDTSVNSVRKLLPLVATTTLVMTFAAMMSLRGLFVALAVLGIVTALSSLIAVALFVDARGAEPWPNTWRGIFNHKNSFGAVSAVSLLVLAPAIATATGALRQWLWIGAVLVLAMLFQSESRTAQIIATISLSSFGIGVLLRGYIRLWALAYIGLMFLLILTVYVLFASGAWDALLGSLGRKPTLSGRIPLWAVVWPNVTEHIWFGYGYDSFWNPDSRSVIEIARDKSVGFLPHYSHNGLIEMLLDIGLFGVPLFLLHVVRGVRGVFAAAQISAARPLAAGGLVIILAFIMFNVTESSILGASSVNWMTFVAISSKLCLVLRARQARLGLVRPAGTGRQAPVFKSSRRA